MIKIPARDLPSYVIEASLDDLAWTLRFDFNASSQMWTMAIADAALVYRLRGVALVANTPLLVNFHHLAIPRGEFVVDARDPRQPVGRRSFLDGSADLYYIPPAEWEAM